MKPVVLADVASPILEGAPPALVGILVSAAVTAAGIALLQNKGRRARQAGIVIAAALAVWMVMACYVTALIRR